VNGPATGVLVVVVVVETDDSLVAGLLITPTSVATVLAEFTVVSTAFCTVLETESYKPERKLLFSSVVTVVPGVAETVTVVLEVDMMYS